MFFASFYPKRQLERKINRLVSIIPEQPSNVSIFISLLRIMCIQQFLNGLARFNHNRSLKITVITN
jgi:hypothetical protein